MQPTGIMFLNDKNVSATTALHSPDWFGRFRKISVPSILCERHCCGFNCLQFSQRDWDFTSSHWALTHHVFRSLVFPQAEESRVSKLASSRPLGESDLRDELGFHPMHAPSRQPVRGKGGNPRLQPYELLSQAPQQILVESRPDLAGIHELPPAVEA
jgi:hypothetical protein